MAIVKDWAHEAADAIIDGVDVPTGLGGRWRDGVREWIVGAIVDHCQMKQDTAYMPVPRCDSCAYWKPYPPDAYSRPAGECKSITIYFESGSKPFGTAADFRLRAVEGERMRNHLFLSVFSAQTAYEDRPGTAIGRPARA